MRLLWPHKASLAAKDGNGGTFWDGAERRNGGNENPALAGLAWIIKAA